MASLRDLTTEIPKEKIYLLQISDAYKVPVPFSEDVEEGSGLRPRGRWSRDFRPYPFNGGYLPVVEVTKAVLATGFRGWFSLEVFDGGKDGKSGPRERGENGMDVFCGGAMESVIKLLDACADD